MSFVTVKCPDCERQTVFNGRGRCRCGTYLVHHFEGHSMLLPDLRTWIRQPDDTWQLVKEGGSER